MWPYRRSMESPLRMSLLSLLNSTWKQTGYLESSPEADPDDDNAAFYHEQADRQLQEFTEILIIFVNYVRPLTSAMRNKREDDNMNTNMNSIVSKMNTISRATRRSSTCVLLLCGLIAALAGGCAEPVEDISYVQPHYVKKDLFQGEWKYKQTVVDMSPESPTGFVGLEGALEKVRWEITQWALIAYRTHEAIPGLDEDDTLDGKAFEGDPVAMFAIQSHFDIRRSYNAATGEQTNVITENTMDRPWFEREYMRVNWSSNMMAGPVDLLFFR